MSPVAEIPTIRSMAEHLTFTADWMKSHVGIWRDSLGHLIDRPNVRGLEVGVYEGRSAVWWLENILTGAGSKLTTIEVWREKFEPNLKTIRAFGVNEDRLVNIWGRAQDVLFQSGQIEPLDFAYLDGGKEAADVLQNSVLVWLLLKPGGILIWDDYEWEWKDESITTRPSLPPKIGIDAFLSAHQGRFTECHRDWQIIVRKNS